MTNKHRKRCSIMLIIIEMQILMIAVRYYEIYIFVFQAFPENQALRKCLGVTKMESSEQ